MEQVYAGLRAIGELLHVRSEDMPADVPALHEWFAATVDREVDDNPMVRQARAMIRRPPRPLGVPIPAPAWWLVRPAAGLALDHTINVLAGVLPTEQRRRMGLPSTPLHRVEYAVLITALRAASVLPRPLLTIPGAR